MVVRTKEKSKQGNRGEEYQVVSQKNLLYGVTRVGFTDSVTSEQRCEKRESQADIWRKSPRIGELFALHIIEKWLICRL